MRASTRMTGIAAFGAAAFALSACGGGAAFKLTSDDNNEAGLAAAYGMMTAPASKIRNVTGKPLVFAVTRPSKDKPRSLLAYDLSANKELWRVQSDVRSKVAIGSAFVAYREGEATLVARDVRSGKQLWKKTVTKGFIGSTADRERVFYVTADRTGPKPVWWLVALNGTTGSELWRADAPGQLGVPAARGGLVFAPFLKQWLTVMDATTGKQLTRIRGLDEEISFVRATSGNVYFGSKVGVFLFDKNAWNGRRLLSTYGKANLPKEFVRSNYYWDAFDPIQSGYSAYDRNHILWRASGSSKGLVFDDGQVVVHTYRFFFSFDAKTGKLKWAYNHPRVDIVGSEHLGSTVGIVSLKGEIGALDPRTGKRLYYQKVEGTLSGATFDADGWAPNDPAAAAGGGGSVQALTSIARDRDARFNDVKRFAVTALAELSGGDVSRDLLVLIRDERTTPKLYAKAVEMLVARKDPAGLPYLVAALDTRYDFIKGTKPRSVGVVAKAIGAMRGMKFDPAARAKAVDALLVHLHEPQLPVAELTDVIRALGAVGGGAERGALRSFLLAYRADPAFARRIEPVSATIDVLLDNGGALERELVTFVAKDPLTKAGVRAYAVRALGQTAK